MIRIRIFMAVCLVSAGLAGAAVTGWSIKSGDVARQVSGDSISLEQAKEGEITAVGPKIGVEPGSGLALNFRYTAENLAHIDTPSGTGVHIEIAELIVTVTWFDGAGKDVDEQLSLQGFPPVKRVLILTKNSAAPIEVADNLETPTASLAGAAKWAQVSFTLKMTGAAKPAKVRISGVTLSPGRVTPKGFDMPDSGPADAGPLSTQPDGYKFSENLVPNGALEEGTDGPKGWKIIGDNSLGSAEWKLGGAYSGKRCFQIFDRGPYLKGWENTTGLYVPGGAPNNGRANAREEVQARFVSEPAPVVPGAYYQASAMLWFLTKPGSPVACVNPLRIQFLDEQGNVLPLRNIIDDGMPDSNLYTLPGWQPVFTFPVPAPATAKSVRVTVALNHALYHTAFIQLTKEPEGRGFVLVDNIALYRVPGQWPTAWAQGPSKTLHTDAFRAAVKDNLVPYVPSSPAHRPNSLRVESWTEHAGGILLSAPKSGETKDLSLHFENLLGDRRPIEVRYDIMDYQGKTLYSGGLKTTLEPFADTRVAVTRPAALPYGPYTLRYSIIEAGNLSDTGETRFAVICPSDITYEEKGRMDYPFAMWSSVFISEIRDGGSEKIIGEMGELLQLAGVGKQVACSIGLPDDSYREGADPKQNAEFLDGQIAQTRRTVEVMRRYGIHPIGWIYPGNEVVPPEKDPILANAIRRLVAGLKDEIHLWGYGSEHVYGGVELDDPTRPDGSKALSWGRKGTVRQWWREYIVAYDTAKKTDQDCLFGPFTCTDTSGKVVHDFFQVSPEKKLDCFEMNMYAPYTSILPAAYAEFRKAGLPDMPFFANEMAIHSAWFPNAPMEGPGKYEPELKAAVNQTTYWVEMLQAFPQLCYGPECQLQMSDMAGDFTYKKRVRPIYVTFTNMTGLLGAGKFTARYEVPGGLVFVRERTAQPGIVGVMWSTATESVVDLEVGTSSVEISDLWGNRRTVKTENGVISISLTAVPQYLLGAKTIKPAASVKMSLANTSLNPHDPQVTVSIRNDSASPVEGTLMLVPESAVAVAPPEYKIETIPVGAAGTFTFQVKPVDPDSDKPLALRVRFVTPQRTYEAVDALNLHFALEVKTPPVIDGKLTEWSADCPFVADREDQLWKLENKKPWSGPEEFSGKLWMRWDAQNLYLAARVRDVGFTPAKSIDASWKSDCIEMEFDLTGRLQKGALMAQVLLVTLPEGPRVYRCGYEPLKPGILESAKVTIRRQGQETVYEAAIPWNELGIGFKAQPGATISTVFGFNDGDNGVRMMSWYHTVSPHDPATFGRVRLVETPAPDSSAGLQPKNLLENGDFDDPSKKPGANLDGWIIGSEKNSKGEVCGKVYLTTDGAWQGRSLCFEKLKDIDNLTATGWTLPVKPGEVYLVRAMAKVLGNTGFILLDVPGYNSMVWMKTLAPGEYIAGTGLALDGPQLADRGAAYAPMAAVFEIPAKVTMITISLAGWNYSYSAGNKVYFDNVELFRLK